MPDSEFEYEVAFSFTQEDEGIARELESRLAPRMRTFIYSKKQERLAGTDGDKSFGDVFGMKARIVVIFYRDKWGKTPWTRIEETAIKNRAFDKGYEFTIWIPTTTKSTLPSYVPKVRLYYSLEHYGMDGAAGMIEARVQDAGGVPRNESLDERAARLQSEIEREEERRNYLQSPAALQDALVTVGTLMDELVARTQTILGWTFSIKRDEGNNRWIDICVPNACLGVTWRQEYSNALKDSQLDVGIWDGLTPRAGRMFYNGEPPRRYRAHYLVDRSLSGELSWANGKQVISASKMADALLELLIQQSHKRSTGERSNR